MILEEFNGDRSMMKLIIIEDYSEFGIVNDYKSLYG